MCNIFVQHEAETINIDIGYVTEDHCLEIFVFKLLNYTLSIILLAFIVNAFSVSQCTLPRLAIDKIADSIASSLGARSCNRPCIVVHYDLARLKIPLYLLSTVK